MANEYDFIEDYRSARSELVLAGLINFNNDIVESIDLCLPEIREYLKH